MHLTEKNQNSFEQPFRVFADYLHTLSYAALLCEQSTANQAVCRYIAMRRKLAATASVNPMVWSTS